MNEQIKELAEQAGFAVYGWNENEFKKFAELVAAQEREACAGLAERRLLIEENKNRIIGYNHAVKSIVETIRARGTT